MIAAFPNSKPADRFRRFKDSQQKHPGTLWRAASDYGLSSGGIGSFSSILRISFGACFRKRRFMSGANSARRSVIASERRQQSDSWCHRKFGHAVGNSCFVANWRTKRPGTRTYWPNPGHTLSVRKKVCAKPRRSPGRKVSTNPRVATMLAAEIWWDPIANFSAAKFRMRNRGHLLLSRPRKNRLSWFSFFISANQLRSVLLSVVSGGGFQPGCSFFYLARPVS